MTCMNGEMQGSAYKFDVDGHDTYVIGDHRDIHSVRTPPAYASLQTKIQNDKVFLCLESIIMLISACLCNRVYVIYRVAMTLSLGLSRKQNPFRTGI